MISDANAARPGKREYEYIVIGLGGIGSGAAYWLARRAGAEVLGLEQYELGHDKGASEDHSRIIRLSYETPAYVELAIHSYKAWHEVEEDASERLIVVCGGLDLWPKGDSSPVSREDHIASMAAHGIPCEPLDAAEIMGRYPQFRLGEGTTGLYQAQSGIAPAGRCNAAHRLLARRHGATLLDNTPVTAVAPLADGMEVTTPDATYRCRRLVVAADAWTNDAWTNDVLRPLGVHIPLTRTQEQVTYYASPRLREFHPDRFPVWIWQDNPCYYGLPVHGEEAGVKVAQDLGGREVTPETRTFDPDRDTLARVDGFMRHHMPMAMGPALYTKTCMYTMPPDRDFIVDTLPAYPQVLLAQGAGHAFKFASILGRVLSELAIDGATAYNIAPFAIDRPLLTMEDPPRAFEMYLRYNEETQGAFAHAPSHEL